MGKNKLMCFQYIIMCFLFAVVPHNEFTSHFAACFNYKQPTAKEQHHHRVKCPQLWYYWANILFSGEMCVFSVQLSARCSILVFRFWPSSHPHTDPPCVFLSLSLSLSSTRCRVQKICYSEFRVPCFLIWWSASWPGPPRAVSEARALTAAAHRSLPYLEVSPTKTARGGGGGGEEEEGGWISSIL